MIQTKELPTIEEIEEIVHTATDTIDLDRAKIAIQRLITAYMVDLQNGRGNISEVEINGSIAVLRSLNDLLPERRKEVANNMKQRFKELSDFKSSAKKLLPVEMFNKINKDSRR